MGSQMVAALKRVPFMVVKTGNGVCPFSRCASIDPDGCAVPLMYPYRAFCSHADQGEAVTMQPLSLGAEVFAVGPFLFLTYFKAFRWAFNHPQDCQRVYWLRQVACGWEQFAYCGEVGIDASSPEQFQRHAAELRAVLLEVRRRSDTGARCLVQQ
ncbi:hypothetical protein [uncultured Thiodictyon sp.]|uniref:hypothetical protein n=1 Tax=uncultured Thiodictyon sp. TaxID=1846217 RepID=UPI0025CDD750|nr:hypothetical protein [uncultured Thiodictyon sp.]